MSHEDCSWGPVPIDALPPAVMMQAVVTPQGPQYQERARQFVRWTLLLCAALGLAVVLAAVYVSLFTGVLVLVAGAVLLAFWSVRRMPEPPPRTVAEQVALLEEVWAKEVPSSQRQMVEAYLADPDAAVAALVGNRASISPEAARQFLASRVTG